LGRRTTSGETADVSESLLTAEEVAALLSVPVSWVRRETRAGRMPHIRLGRYRRYSSEAVVEWLGEQKAGQWRKAKPVAAVGTEE
jgi:excisionase family DNA binding protein